MVDLNMTDNTAKFLKENMLMIQAIKWEIKNTVQEEMKNLD